jgi:CDGSH-type Zn-finger protein
MDKSDPRKIRVLKDGPYLVTGKIPLVREVMVIGADREPESWRIVENLPAQSIYSLCRCGRSRRMPFCDGSHTKTGFDGTENAPRKNYLDLAEKTEGPALILTDAACYCAIARFCYRAGDAWTRTEHSDDPESRRIAVEEAGNCPSGRLVAWDKETGKPIEPAFEPSLSLTQDTKHFVSGPVWVKGGVPVESADGFVYEIRNRMTLCRCGASKGKPFCDGSHLKLRFNDGHPSVRKAPRKP